MSGEHHSISPVKLHGACKHHSFDIAPDLSEVLGILRMSDSSDVLLDDRALVELR